MQWLFEYFQTKKQRLHFKYEPEIMDIQAAKLSHISIKT